jgi:hypothetical protein
VAVGSLPFEIAVPTRTHNRMSARCRPDAVFAHYFRHTSSTPSMSTSLRKILLAIVDFF